VPRQTYLSQYSAVPEDAMLNRLIPLTAIVTTAAFCQQPSLKDAFQGLFRVGAALNQRQFEEKDPRANGIVAAQFDTISPENVMKWEVIHPRVDGYNFGPADEYVAFGQKYKMFIVGHNLVWHSQVPRWVFQDDKGAPLTRDALLERMKEHITTVVTRYKGKIGGWDVVNEALNEDGTLRKSQWLNIIGEDYLVKAFQYAHEADPNCELYYNDYSIENEAKRKGAVDLIKKLQAAGVKVAAMGLQGHDSLDWPTLQQQEDTIDAFAALGVKIAITELDVDVLPRAERGNSADVSATSTGGANPYVNGLPDDIQQALAKRYAELFAVFVKHANVMSRVTFWGVTDGDSWKNNFPVRGRTNYPLLFDREGKPKPAFHSVIQTARKK
jgi:endo-1,4-beta-xylanase